MKCCKNFQWEISRFYRKAHLVGHACPRLTGNH